MVNLISCGIKGVLKSAEIMTLAMYTLSSDPVVDTARNCHCLFSHDVMRRREGLVGR